MEKDWKGISRTQHFLIFTSLKKNTRRFIEVYFSVLSRYYIRIVFSFLFSLPFFISCEDIEKSRFLA